MAFAATSGEATGAAEAGDASFLGWEGKKEKFMRCPEASRAWSPQKGKKEELIKMILSSST